MSALIPYGIGLLAAVLKSSGFTTAVFDATMYKSGTNDPNIDKVKTGMVKPFDYSERNIKLKTTDMYEDLRKKVEEFQPNLIAITSVESTYFLALELLKSIKSFRIPCVYGGVFATFAPEEIISNDGVDFVCRGEGEGALLELCQKMSRREDVTNIANLWVKKDDKIYKNVLRNPIDLDTLPFPDYDDFDDMAIYRPMTGKIWRMLGIETARGCPYSCSYCNSPSSSDLYNEQTGQTFYRQKSIYRIIEELKFLKKKYEVEFLYILADTFLSLKEDILKEFAQMYKDIDVPFWMNTRPETVTEKKMNILEGMKIHRMGMGVEHGNEEFRKKMLNRRISNSKIIRAFEIASNANCSVTSNNMIGFPGETRELVFDTINFNRQLPEKVEATGAFIFSPFRGTPLRDIAIRLKQLDPGTIVSMNYTSGTALNLPGLSQEELVGLTRVFSFYMKFPETMYEQISIAEKFDEDGENMYLKLLKQYQEEFLN